MAKQDANPPPWDRSMSDGCTGVLDWLPFVGSIEDCCVDHDEAFHWGGTREDFVKANKKFFKCIHKKKRCWFCHQVAKVVAHVRRGGVRRFGWKHFNRLGPGPPQKELDLQV